MASSNTPSRSQPIKPSSKRNSMNPETSSANASPSSRPMGIASPPVPNIPPRQTDSPFGTSFKPRSFASSVQDKGGDFGSSLSRNRLDSGNPNSKSRSASGVVGKDLKLGEKREPAPLDSAQGGNQKSVLTARLGDEQDKKDDDKDETRGRSSTSRSGGKSRAGSTSDDRQAEDKPSRRADLELPTFPRQVSASSLKNNNNNNKDGTTTPGESGISTHHVVTPTQIEEIPEEEKLRILRRHLVSAEERQAGEARRGSVVDHETPRTSIMQSQAQGGGGGDRENHASTGGQGSRSRKSSTKSGSLLPDFRNASGLNVPQDTVVLNEDGPGTTTGRSSRKGSMRLQDDESQDVFPMPYDALGGDVT